MGWDQTATTRKTGENGESQFEVAPAGQHLAVVVALIDEGTQAGEFQGKPITPHKMVICWELVATASRLVVWKDYTLSFAESANLRKDIETWRGKAFGEEEQFDLTKLLGKPCQLTIEHKKSSKGNNMAIVKGIKGTTEKVAAPQNKPFAWLIGDGEYPNPAWVPYIYGRPIREMIEASPEWKAWKAGANGDTSAAAAVAAVDDEIPF